MRTRRFSVALAALSIPLLAGSAFAVANSVSTTPGPQVIIPSRTSANSPSTIRHDSTKVTTKVTTPDDHGNDGAAHDVNDDRGHDGTTVTTTADDHGNDGPGHDVGDDGSGHGSDNNGSGQGSDNNSGPGSGSSGPGN